jgi:hypothetical protein
MNPGPGLCSVALLCKSFEVRLEQWYPLSVVGWIESSLCCLVSVLPGTSLRYVRLNDYFAYIFSKLKLLSTSMQSLITSLDITSLPVTPHSTGTHFVTWVFAPVFWISGNLVYGTITLRKITICTTELFPSIFNFYLAWILQNNIFNYVSIADSL